MKYSCAKNEDIYRDLLQTFIKINRSHPTKEFLTTRLVRCILRIFKFIRNNKLPNKTAIKIDPKNSLQNEYWRKLVDLFREEQNQPSILFGGNGELETRVKFNCRFYKEFFNENFNKRALKILIRLFYSDTAPLSLSEKFNFSCCLNSVHSEDCTEKWHKLQEFLTTSFLEYY